jgi:uncharacterized membrane protein YdbT with pleckstrin-like domain
MSMDSNLHARAALSTLIIFECFAVLIFSLFFYAAVVRNVGWEGAIVGFVLCVGVFIWWRGFSVEIDGLELCYRAPFKAKRTIALRDIQKAVRTTELVSQGNRPLAELKYMGPLTGKK